MKPHRTHKRNLIVSYKNISDELKGLLKEAYPDGYKEHLQRSAKPNGEPIFVVPLETEDTVYMVKFDVKIDTTFTDDEPEKDYFDEEVEKVDVEFAPLQEAIDKEEEADSVTHTERQVRHGAYEDLTENRRKKKAPESGSLSALGEELTEAFSDEYDEEEDSDDYDEEEGEATEGASPDEGEEYEPTDEELMDIDSEIFANAEIPPEELARMEAEQSATEPEPKKPSRRKKA